MSAPQCFGAGINPSTIPGDDLHPDAIEAAADGMTTDANTIRDAGADVVSTWRGLGACYQAPEAETLFAVMDPVETNARDFADDLAAVATALRNFAADIRPIKSGFAAVRADAWDFRDTIAGNDEWEYDQDLIDQNTDLLRRVNALQVQLWEAERTCANAIRALYGAAPWHAMTSQDDPLGYGIDEIPTDADMPWGSEVQRRDHCPKSAGVSVKRFVWDGLVVDGLWGTVVGLGSLVGVSDWEWHWETMRDSWEGMSALIGNDGNGHWSWGNAGEAWTALGKGVISYDVWEDDPARAAGGAIFNVVTTVIPVAGWAGKGGRVAAAGSRAARVSSWLTKATTIVDLTDPVALTIRGARLALPKIDDLLVGMRGALEGLTDSITVPDIPLTGLDDLPTTGLDDVPAVHTPDVEVPPVRTPDADVPNVEAPAPVRVPEPAHVGGGPDDLLSGPRDPNTHPGTTTGSDAPTGTHTTPEPPRTPDAPQHGGNTPGDTPGGHAPDDGPGTPGGGGADDAVPGGDPTPDGPGGTPDHTPDHTPGDSPDGSPDHTPDGPDDAADTPGAPVAEPDFGRIDDVLHGGADEGPGWHRADDRPVDPDYGTPRADAADHLPDWASPPAEASADIRAIGGDVADAFGRDPVTGEPLTREEWTARYTTADGGVRWPDNGGAVPGTQVTFTDPQAFVDTFGGRLDRVGEPTGTYLGVPPGALWPERAITPDTLGSRVHRYEIDPVAAAEDGIEIRVSEVAPAFGQPGGGIQVLFFRDGARMSVETLLLDGVLR